MSEHYDVLVKNTTIVDGTGSPAFQGSIGISGEQIAAVGDLAATAATEIDGGGLVTCPGFVDPHNHGDFSLLQYPLAENLVMQGITSIAGGNCGMSVGVADETFAEIFGLTFEPDWKTFGEWLSKVQEVGPSVNFIPLVGHNTVRGSVMGEDFKREATDAEIERMKPLVEEAMQSGAFGLSAGLDAAWPGHFAHVDEIVELAKIAQAYGGLYSPHTRHHQNQWPAADPSDYGYGIFHAPTGEAIAGRYHGLWEAVEISRQANRIPLHIAHFTPAYIIPQPHPEFLDEAAARATLVEIIDKAHDQGLDVTYNVIAWSQSIGSQAPLVDSFISPDRVLPDWLKEMSNEEFVEGLKTRDFRDKVKNVVYGGRFKFRMIHPLTDPYWFDCFRILRCQNKAYEGRTVGEIARDRQPDRIIEAVYDASVEALFDILLDDPNTTWVDFIDKREYGALAVFLQHPAGMPCTDVQALPATPSTEDGMLGYGISPTAYGLYPHYLRVFVKEKGALSLEEAVKKATSVPAQEVFGLQDRGVLREGACADVLVFDLESIRENEDFLNPAQPPEGIEYVLVNGTVVYENQAHTGARPGKVLRRA